ncbi:MAG: DUF512 domain-containing protein [Nitrospirota bacterium]
MENSLLAEKMIKEKGIAIVSVDKAGYAFDAGIRVGDKLISINGHKISDPIDYKFYQADEILKINISRDDEVKEFIIEKKEDEDIGLELSPMRIRRCPNKCIFCFVDQMPEDCRESLYIKDEDYRFSFLYGSYLTLTNLTKKDKERIFEQRLSPLYISVHTTDNDLRREMLGNKKAPDIIKEIEELTQHRIYLHTQIVLCPGINDEDYLKKSINDLKRFYPFVSSIAVVPVGQTRHRVNKLRPVDKNYAKRAIEGLSKIKKEIKRELGEDILFIADEFYIKAGMDFPEIDEYADFPQLENGVGLVPLFLSEFNEALSKINNPPSPPFSKVGKGGNKKIFTITGASFAPYLNECTAKLKRDGFDIDVVTVKNNLLGESVTVAGLLSGKDILSALRKYDKGIVLIPSVALREAGDRFLDNMTPDELRRKTRMEIKIVGSDACGLIDSVFN